MLADKQSWSEGDRRKRDEAEKSRLFSYCTDVVKPRVKIEEDHFKKKKKEINSEEDDPSQASRKDHFPMLMGLISPMGQCRKSSNGSV